MLKNTALFAAVLAALPACDREAKDEPMVDPAADVTREGEPCEADAPASCRVGGVDGVELCQWGAGDSGYNWSACLNERCEAFGDWRDCAGGKQYCVEVAFEGAAERMWGECTDAGECLPGETQGCGFDESISMGCELDSDGVPRWNEEDCNTPLVLSFGATIEFSAASAAAADFDIHGGPGVCTRADWPGAVTPWLALDRDHSGAIEGGHELFGSGTRLAAGTAATNGFLALAELDTSGDGRISAADARWSELVLWADHDGDRRSSNWELLPLASFEVVAIELAYFKRRECDRAGNCGLERASFVYRSQGQERVGEVVDVHLACD